MTATRIAHTFLFIGVIFTAFLGGEALAQSIPPAIITDDDIFHPQTGYYGMVVSQEEQATKVGVDILKKGGNAVDAAVAVGYALSATLPRAGNLGGGGFMMVHLAQENKTITIDYREMAPASASRDMFLDAAGHIDSNKSLFSHQSAGVPGTVAGLNHALEHYGTMSLQDVMAPAIRLAKEGFSVSEDLSLSLAKRRENLERWPSTKNIFIKEDGQNYRQGDQFKQPDLANSLKLIAENGTDAFYKGAIADKLVADMQAHNGLITHQDLANYEVIERKPIKGTYRGYDVFSMPPPSSGGISLVQTLNILSHFNLNAAGPNSATSIHLMAEALKHAYADRSRFLGDPDFVQIPIDKLLSMDYAKGIAETIAYDRAMPSSEILGPEWLKKEGPDTTHFSVMDQHGNAVSNTYTLNFSYGSGIIAEGTGILLNNEMDDFSAKPGTPNAYGLVSNESNAIVPRKRPLSSMTPTIVLKDGHPFLITGSPGGSRIITSVLQILLNVIDHRMNPMAATTTPRIHHQWLPDELRLERGISPDTIKLLKRKGHKVAIKSAMGATETIMYQGGTFYGAADPRRRNALALGVLTKTE